MKKVYFTPIDSYYQTNEISQAAAKLLRRVIEEEEIKLSNKIPLKVHFGEKGNITFINSQNYQGIIDYLTQKDVETCFIETNVLYSGSRMTRNVHIKTAQEHGFTQLPIVIADGDHGDDYQEVEINKKHFKSCKIGKEFANYDQFIIISHFKGHALAGFGGAIKQLGMGFASRGGKLAQHINAKPFIIPFKCKKCKVCVKHCPVDAIKIGGWSKIDHKKCIGCAGCIAVCPHQAIFLNVFKVNLANKFREKIVEYAYAAQKEKRNIYISFAFNITKNCDCDGRKMKPIANDMGIFASTDPVAIDSACMNVLDKREGKSVFKGRHALDYGEKIGMGNKEYELVEV